MSRTKILVPLLTALLTPLTAGAQPTPIPASSAVGPVRSDTGDGLCVTLVHINNPPAPPFTGPSALTNAITALNLPIGQDMIDQKISQVYRYARFHNMEATAVGDFPMAAAATFPFETNLAARIRGYVSITPANQTYSNAIYADAGARLRIGGATLLQFDQSQTVRWVKQVSYGQPGLYPIEIVYYANGGIAVLEASMASSAEAEGAQLSLDTTRFHLLPENQLFTARAGHAQSCLECSADSTCGQANYCAHDWGGGGPGPDGVCAPCATNDHCGSACVQCGAATPVCVAGTCVQCGADSDCGDGYLCQSSLCVAAPPCTSNSQCDAGQTCNLATHICVTACSSNVDCPVGTVCDLQTLTCEHTCQSNAQCATGQQCNLQTSFCEPLIARYSGGCSAAPASSGANAPLAALVPGLLLALWLRRRRQALRTVLAGAAVFFSLSAGRANAQISANAQTFQPALGPENVFTVEGTRTPQPLRPVLMALLEYADRPIYLRSANGDVLANTVPDMTTLHLLAGLGVTRWLSFGLGLPVVLYQGFDRANTPTSDVASAPAVAGVGDLRLFAKWRIINNQAGGFGLAFNPQVTFPTGSGTSFRGDDAVGIQPRFALDYRWKGGSFIAANLGFLGRTSSQIITNINVGSQFTYGAGGQLALPRGFGLLAELIGSVSVQEENGGIRYTPTEMYGGFRWAARSGLNVLAGVGGGLTEAVGSPHVRVFAGLGYLPGQVASAPRPATGHHSLEIDKWGTGTGIVRALPGNIECGTVCSDDYAPGAIVALTAVPTGKSTFVGWSGPCSGTDPCTVEVRDRTRVGARFAHQDEPKALVTVDKSGDGTGVVSSDPMGIDCGDMCQASYLTGREIHLHAKANPGFYFAGWSGPCSGEDATCSFTVEGTTTVGASFRRSAIEYKQDRLILKESILFETAKADIKTDSYGLLDEAVVILKQHPNIMLRIEGHTDNVPFKKAGGNKVLSHDRAEAVVGYIVAHGISAARLSSEGYGETCPIASNATQSGRSMNRRTEFWIVNPGDPAVTGCLVKQRPKAPKAEQRPQNPELPAR